MRTPIKRERRALLPPGVGPQIQGVSTADSFANFAQKLGVGADNALSSATYGYNPITRNRVLLEWIHRGSWLGGIAVDTVADDMTRAGVEPFTDLAPDVAERVEYAATKMKLWDQVNETIKWARLYGGAIMVALVDGQDMRTPLDMNTVAPGQFKGVLCLDRWMLDPTLEDLVTEFGPDLGMPRYYRVQPNAPALRGEAIHYSRVLVRMEGVPLPYQQRLTENLWGISVLERLYDRMIAFDSASTGAAQLVYKSYLRTLSVEGLRDIISAGGTPLNGLYAYVDVMRRFQGLEGITLLDKNDEFNAQQHSAFSGLSDALVQFGQQLSGALQIPLVRLFGQSPAGLNATGESDLRMYYDHINQQQERHLLSGITKAYRLLGTNVGAQFPSTFAVGFKSLWQLTDTEKSEIASKDADTISKSVDAGLIGRKTALNELRQSSRITGIFTHITDETIKAADDEVQPPGLETMGLGIPGLGGLNDGTQGSPGNPLAVDDGEDGGAELHERLAGNSPSDRPDGPGNERRRIQLQPTGADPAKLRGPDQPMGRERRQIRSD